MKTSPSRRRQAGYVSSFLVLSTGTVLTLLTVYAYRRAMNAQAIQAQVQLRVGLQREGGSDPALHRRDHSEPRDPGDAGQDSNSTGTVSRSAALAEYFHRALVLANARTSISSNLVVFARTFRISSMANSGDSALTSTRTGFSTRSPAETGYVSAGINRSLGTGYPPPLTIQRLDHDRPGCALSDHLRRTRQYGTLAQSPDVRTSRVAPIRISTC